MTTNPAARTFSSDFKRFFIRGLVVLLPSVLTLWIVVQAYRFVFYNIAEPINGWIRIGLVQMAKASPPLRNFFGGESESVAANVEAWWVAQHWFLDVIGVIVAIVVVYVAGRLLGGFFGRHIYRWLENFITALPVFKQVYPYVKQVVDFLFSDERPIKFNRVVVMEYPRKGIWSVGFLTGNTMRSIARESGDAVTVFVPSSPTPFTGYTITVPRSEVIELPITVEEAIRFAVTGGVLIPRHQLADEAGEADAGHDQGRAAALPLTGTNSPQTADGSGPTESRRDAG